MVTLIHTTLWVRDGATGFITIHGIQDIILHIGVITHGTGALTHGTGDGA